MAEGKRVESEGERTGKGTNSSTQLAQTQQSTVSGCQCLETTPGSPVLLVQQRGRAGGTAAHGADFAATTLEGSPSQLVTHQGSSVDESEALYGVGDETADGTQ